MYCRDLDFVSVYLSDVCRNSGEIIKASGSFLNEGSGQTIFCIAHGSSSKTSPIFSIIQVRIALFLSGTGNIHEAEGIYIFSLVGNTIHV